jgi:hypothetical protein
MRDIEPQVIKNSLEMFINYYKSFDALSGYKKIRRPNFPEHISEYIVQSYLNKFNGKYNCHRAETGDLLKSNGNKIEVKCINSDGPISFGPNEKWSELYIVDVHQLFTGNENTIKIFFIPKTNYEIHALRISRSETFGQQCEQKRRPRCHITLLHEFFKEDMRLIYNHKIDYLF